jgi:hypothetical protein
MERMKTESPPTTLLAAVMPLRAFPHSNRLSVFRSLHSWFVIGADGPMGRNVGGGGAEEQAL